MLSDADVMFSFLFMKNLLEAGQEDGLFLFFLVMVALGVFTYAVGVFWIAPAQKHRIPKLVLKFMAENPRECISTRWYKEGPRRFKEVPLGSAAVPPGREVTICRDLQAFPNPQPGQHNPRIGDCDTETLKASLGQWGLGSVWDSIEQKKRMELCRDQAWFALLPSCSVWIHVTTSSQRFGIYPEHECFLFLHHRLFPARNWIFPVNHRDPAWCFVE